VINSTARRLKAVEDHFARIEQLIKELRKQFTDLAEEVRIVAEEVGIVARPPKGAKKR
jgi:chromosome segregation ATPase